MKRHLRFGLLIQVVAAAELGLGTWGCTSDVTAPGSGLQAPPAGSGAGLLAVEVESFGSLNTGADLFAAAPADSSHGHGRRTPVTALYVTFDSLRVFPACEDSLDGGDSTMAASGQAFRFHGNGDGMHEFDGECGYFDLLTEPVTVNVADLDSTLTEILGTLQLPEGDYTHLALHLADAWVVTADGDSVAAFLPGGMENWLKVIVPFSVEDGEVTVILISFDLDHSLVEAPPGSLHFLVKPVLHGHLGCGHAGGDCGDRGHHGGGNGDHEGGGHGNGGGNGHGRGHGNGGGRGGH